MKSNQEHRISSFLLGAVLLGFGIPCAYADQDPVCEVLNGTHCYYIDPIHGSDENNGSFVAPWRSFRNVVSYYSNQYRPGGWVDLQPGGCIYLLEGTYSEIIYPGAWLVPPEEGGGGGHIAYFRGKHGDAERPFTIKAYPGHHPVFDLQFSGMGLTIQQSSFWDVSGIEIRNAYQVGLLITGTSYVKVHDVHIHDTDGVDNNNIAGLSMTGTSEVEVFNSEFHDNYDRTCADTEGRSTHNSSNIVIFAGEFGKNITIRDCLIWQSLPTTHVLSGAGLKYKHASRDPNSYFHVFRNVFRNCKYFAMQAATPNTHFHHNLIVGGDNGVSCANGGGTTHQVYQVYEYNTFYGTTGFSCSPTILWRNKVFPDDPHRIVFRNNIVYDTTPRYHQERNIVGFGAYMSNELYHLLVPEVTLENNCYFNPTLPVQFGFAAGFNYREGFELGGMYTLSEWQAEYGYDLHSIEADPLFVDPNNDDFRLTLDTPCVNMGRYHELSPWDPNR
ncbi:right-handed parallel beta-helix repeat-containing protein [Planctomycetota bacterium]